MTWISDTTTRIADATGIDAGTNAPLLCHVLGRAVALGARLDMPARVIDDAAGG